MIFVVDSSDKFRIPVAKNELDMLLAHSCTHACVLPYFIAVSSRPIPILFYANKMDVPGAASEGEVAKEIQLDTIKDRPWNILYN